MGETRVDLLRLLQDLKDAYPGPVEETIITEILEAQYPTGVRFRVNGRAIGRAAPDPGRVPLEVRVGRQRKPSGVGFLRRDPGLAREERGIAVSTLGKVIKRGWDWLGVTPVRPADVGGLIEVPALAESLTLNKADFVRSGARGATFLAYRKAVQEAVTDQLEAWDEGPEASGPRRPRTGTLERDLRSVLADLSEEYPILATLVERKAGGQRRLPLSGGPSIRGVAPGAGAGVEIEAAGGPEGAGAVEPSLTEDHEGGERSDAGAKQAALPKSAVPGSPARKRPARYGLRIRFESRPDDPTLGRLVETTVWVNDAHPAYRRAAASRSEAYHLALAVGMALADVAVEPVEAQTFVRDFLVRWGASVRNGGSP